ncbi:HD domain-containing phosphohydrolase [Wukongibacter baidiensis]|uniref:HD domain-containing phosphohydrolase n=1 Tax=Wukongibacter baidiensis TaxID=1723361 RepID=UPI003D7FB20B
MKKLSSKIIIIFLLVFIALASTVLTSYIAIDTQKQHMILTELLSKQKLLIERVINISGNTAEFALIEPTSLEEKSSENIETVNKYIDTVEFMLHAFETKQYPIDKDEVVELKFRKDFEKIFLDAIKESQGQWKDVKDSVSYLMNKENITNYEEYRNKYNDFKELNKEVLRSADYITEICKNEADQKKDLSERMQLMSIVFASLIFILLVYIIWKDLYGPFTEIKEAFIKMSRGDFGKRFYRKKDDEFKELYNKFNYFIDNLQEIFRLEDRIIMENQLDKILIYIDKNFKKFLPFRSIAINYEETDGSLTTRSVENEKVSTYKLFDGELDLYEKLTVEENVIKLPIIIDNKNLGTVFFDFEESKDIDESRINFISILSDKITLAFYKSFLFTSLLSIVTESLSETTEARDPETGNHLIRMSNYSQIIARNLYKNGKFKDEIDEKFIEDIKISAPMHDIGKVSIPDNILLKPGKLTDEEFEIMKTHTLRGGEVLKNLDIKFKSFNIDYFQIAAEIATGHHEKYDGTGYPYGLRREEIPLAARITAVGDVFDALTSKRPYKEAFSLEKSYRIIEESKDKHFDPIIVEAFLDAREEIEKIYQEYKEV